MCHRFVSGNVKEEKIYKDLQLTKDEGICRNPQDPMLVHLNNLQEFKQQMLKNIRNRLLPVFFSLFEIRICPVKGKIGELRCVEKKNILA